MQKNGAPLEKHHMRLLPSGLQPGDAFDGSDLDRLALCERLLAMKRLGIFDRLATSAAPVILEIGAGYGVLAAALRRAFPCCVYLIVDLPHSLALSGCYLASRQAGRVSVVSRREDVSADICLVLNTNLAANSRRATPSASDRGLVAVLSRH